MRTAGEGVTLEVLIARIEQLKAANPDMTTAEIMHRIGADRQTVQLCLDFIEAEKGE
jgi:hypothetical protein